MFFLISKTVGLLIEPFYMGLFLLAVAGLLRLARRAQRLRKSLVIFAGCYVLLFAFGPTANLLLYPLETAHSRPAVAPKKVGAVIMMGGVVSRPEKGEGRYEMAASADRFVEALRLANRHPGSILVITGGSSAILSSHFREADALGDLTKELGFPQRRLRVDRDSRNTHENAVHTGRLLVDVPGPYVLVTSAAHMPRSVACFRKQGMDVIPWPVDFHRTGSGPGAWVPKPQTLIRTNIAMHEYAGWAAYWLAGYL